jgi:hypothetical protein
MDGRKIYPDYDFDGDDYRSGFMTHIRKQNSKGIWYLIPVVQRWEHPEGITKTIMKDFLKRCHTECYKLVLFYIVPEEGEEHMSFNGVQIETKDPSQISERDRLIIKT